MADDPREPTPNLSPSEPEAAPAGARLTASRARDSDTIVVFQHSTLFYWWPVWFFGFLFALITYLDGHLMAIVPPGTEAATARTVTNKDGNPETRDVLIVHKDRKLLTTKDDNDNVVPRQPSMYVTRYRSLGTMFLFILLLVIFITNVTLRGQWSLVVLIIMIAIAVIFWLAGYWEGIFEYLGNLSIYMNMGAYMMLSLVVFILWVTNVFFFDRQMYVVFTPGNVRICQEIGMGETIYDTFQMTVQKQRSDLFRHVILGFGSGDVIMQFPRHPNPIELHNILNINKVLKQVENLTHEKRVVQENSPPASPPAKA